MLIDATHAEETRVVVVDGTKVEEFDFETVNKRQISGNIYLAKITRVEPSLQAAFVDYGGNRHGFLAFAEIHPDYYQIPAADRDALIAEERAYAEAQEAEDAARAKRRQARSAKTESGDEIEQAEAEAADGERSDETTGESPDADHGDGDDTATAASDKDEDIESVADEDVAEEIHAPKKPRARRYKIQEVVKVRQIMLVQVVKEERGNKGAALTTYLSLPGRYCVLMPNTARGGGISRKITNAVDRKKLKDIASELDVPRGAGLIIRTAGSQRTRTEIRRDYEYLLRLWEQIRDLTFKSIAPAPIYEEGDLIKRTIRDLYNSEIDEVLVEGERGFRTAKDFMKMIMPTHSRAVQQYTDQMPLFARYQVESYLAGMFNPVVQLKSGGYIVIGVTEALVAIDVNSGRATKEGSIEDTALKTNLEAADEVARQLRLRDLAGLIVIDFIDMEERRNNAAVEKRMKDKLKSDRARIQMGRISGFGLMEMSRQRLRPGMLESTTQPCAHCHGTGLIRSEDSLALTILRAIEEEGTRKRSREVLVKAPVAVANFLINQKREHIAGIEARYGLSVRLEADPSLISPDFAIEKFKTATRSVPDAAASVLSVDADLMAQIDDEDEDLADDAEADDAEAGDGETDSEDTTVLAADEDGEGRGRRRRRRRRRKSDDRPEGETAETDEDSEDGAETAQAGDIADEPEAADGEQNSRRRRSRSRNRRRGGDQPQHEGLPEVVDLRDNADEPAPSLPGLNARPERGAAPESLADDRIEEDGDIVALSEIAVEPQAADPEPEAGAVLMAEPQTGAAAAEIGATGTDRAEPARADAVDPAEALPAPEAGPDAGAAGREPEMAEADDGRPKRRGWWSGHR
ncbi:RNAse E [Paracoccus sediminis]|nr:RNAse E [Paracoccus sediminis]